MRRLTQIQLIWHDVDDSMSGKNHGILKTDVENLEDTITSQLYSVTETHDLFKNTYLDTVFGLLKQRKDRLQFVCKRNIHQRNKNFTKLG